MSKKPLLDVLDGVENNRTPIWLMRQAGRYLPEYRELRQKASSFLEFCYRPDMAAEATLQPVRRFDLDAAIIFSDILVIPDALGQQVSFETGEGPRLEPIDAAFVHDRRGLDEVKLSPVYEAIEQVRDSLPDHLALIGFCGAPWTLATYMIAGKGTPDQQPARAFAYAYPEVFEKLIGILTDACAEHLAKQIKAGADVVQIFDSWAGVLPSGEFERWCLRPILKLVEKLRARIPDARVIVFARGVGERITQFGQLTGASGLGLDTSADAAFASSALPSRLALQGNIDPYALVAGGKALDCAVDRCLSDLRGRRHILNLGHGVVPQTPVAHVEQLIARVRKART